VIIYGHCKREGEMMGSLSSPLFQRVFFWFSFTLTHKRPRLSGYDGREERVSGLGGYLTSPPARIVNC